MTQNILSYALSNDCKVGFSSGTFPGNSYTEELPDEGIKYGTWEITKRSQNTITIKVFSPYKSTMWVNSYVNTDGWNGWKQMVVNTDLGGAVFQPASGNIKYGMNGIYIGAFSNGPLQSDGTAFEACIYLIATKGWLTVAYVFPITQYSEGHLFFNRMNHNNAWELSSWKKLIA